MVGTMENNTIQSMADIPGSIEDARENRNSFRSELVMRLFRLEMTTLTSGVLNSWFSPAVRGLVLKPLRDQLCRENGGYQANAGRSENGLRLDPQGNGYCRGCLKNGDCGYGRVFEPDLRIIDPRLIHFSAEQGLRGITFAGKFSSVDTHERVSPLIDKQHSSQVHVPSGSELLLRMLSLGEASQPLIPRIVQALDTGGKTSGLWGQPPVFFSVNPKAACTETWSLPIDSLPTAFCGGILPSVQIVLQSLLSLKRSDRSQTVASPRRFSEQASTVPTFREIFSNSLRTVRRAVNEFADPTFLSELQLGQFINSAQQVELIDHDLRFFEQQRASRRTDGHNQTGWLGTVTFRNVPLAYLPWLNWAGKLGIGDSRNCGAGLFHLVID